MKKALIILLYILLVSCGFNPIYSSNNQQIKNFEKITLEGDSKINAQIINKLGLTIDTSSNQEIFLKTNYIILETSKNSKGEIETYRSVLNVQLTIKNKMKILTTRDLSSDTSYNNINNKFELKRLQNKIKENLISDISEKMILILKLL